MAQCTDNRGNVYEIMRRARVILVLLILLVSSTQAFLQGFFFLPIAFISPPAYAYLSGFATGFWHRFAVTLIEYGIGLKLVITGNPPKGVDPSLMLMNHRTRLDWLFFFGYQARYGSFTNFKICLKDSLKHIVGAGWVIQAMVFLFFKRDWEHDKKVITRGLHYYFRVKQNPQILLFPEGTDFTDQSKDSSDRFAQKHDLPELEHVLHPRTAGFMLLFKKLDEYAGRYDLVDVTVGYPFNVCQNEADLLAGNIPKEVHFHVETIQKCLIPVDQNGLDLWLRDLWRRKDERLSQFEENKRFSEAPCRPPPGSFKYVQLLAAVFWSFHLVISTIWFIHEPTVQLCYLWSFLMYLFGAVFFSGVDVMMASIQAFNERWCIL